MPTMTMIRRILPLIALLLALPAQAAEPVFPPGSRVGLVPPAGMTESQTFIGFEDRDQNVALSLVGLPADAFAELEKTLNAGALKKQGVTLEKREALRLPIGKAVLLTGRQDAKGTKLRKLILVAGSPVLTALVTVQIPDAARARYPDVTFRAAFETIAVRTTIPVDEQLSLLPFKVSELAGFKVAGLIPGRAVMLSDAGGDAPPVPGSGVGPHIFAAVAAGGPGPAGDKDHFAREVFSSVPSIKAVRITASEPLRISGAQGHQIFANAKDPTSEENLSVVQWLRFGGGGYLQIIGVSRADAWRDSYPRFRSVRDGIEPR